jgi:hypothetical protein
MDQGTYDEIISVLAMVGRPDLIAEFQVYVEVDEDYVPKFMRRDSLSNSEGSAATEEEYEVEEDENGFCSLK